MTQWYEAGSVGYDKGVPFTNPVAPTWPLGLVTVPQAGHPVMLAVNVGPNDGSWMGGQPRCVRQLIVSASPTNKGNVFIVMPGYDHHMTNGVVLIVLRGTIGAIPLGCLTEGARLNVDSLDLDAEYDNDGAYICGIYG